MSHPATNTTVNGHFLVCEDGSEYVDRFNRFLGPRFTFTRVSDFQGLRAYLEGVAGRGDGDGDGDTDVAGHSSPIVGLLFDLDFRRTPQQLLVDELGRPAIPESADEHRRIAASQGIAILCAIRHRGCGLPALLFADLEDPSQCEYLRSALGPLTIIPSSVGLNELLVILDAIAQA